MNNLTNLTANRRFPSPLCRETFTLDVVEGTNGLLLMIAYIANMVFIVIANAALIFGLVRTGGKKFTSSTKYFLVLASSDMLAGIVLMPLQVYFIQVVPDVSCVLTGIRAFWSVFPLTFSGFTIMILTIDRFLVIAGNKKHNRHGYKDIVLYVFIVFIISFGWGLWYTLVTQQTSFRKMAVLFICLGVFEGCVLITSVVFNYLILQKVQELSKNTSIKGNKRKAEQRLTKTITIISGTLVVNYTPSVIGLFMAGAFFYDLTVVDIILKKVTKTEIRNMSIGLVWSLLPTLINSGLNACIYIVRNKKMRQMYKSIYNRNIRLPDSSDETTDNNSTVASQNNINGSASPRPSPIILKTLKIKNGTT